MNLTVNSLKRNVPLKDLVTFKLGGPAEYFYEATSSEALISAIALARSKGMPWFLLGGGSNLVVADDGIEGLVVHNQVTEFKCVDHQTRQVNLSSGLELEFLVELALQLGMSGAECFAGIPGSIGGAIYGNAGAYGRSIADILIDAQLLFPDGSVQTVPNSFFQFDYRSSMLKREPHIVLNARFQLDIGKSEEIKAKIAEIIEQRHSKHPAHEVGCAGSFFKNLPPLPGEERRRAAGSVLEQAGAKAMHCGGAKVFEKHANFIINEGQATARDVKNLADMLKQKVLKDFGIELSEEVLYVGRI